MENQTETLYQQEDVDKYAWIRIWKDRLYRFFYNIWPGVNRFLTFVFYHLSRVIRGFFKIAMEQFKH